MPDERKVLSNKYFTLAVAAGVCGSLSSLFGKLCFDSDLVRSFAGEDSTYLFYGVRAFFFGLLVLSNVLMTSLFTRSLDSSDNSFKPTIINFSSNFLFTGIVGVLVLKESVDFCLWLVGISLIITGVFLLNGSAGQEQGGKKELKRR